MNKQTPGPWFIGRAVGSAIVSIIGDGDSVVCDLYGRAGETADADARLIAAAPDLLDALERIALAASSTVCNTDWVARHAMEAIAKARGEA